MPTGAFDARGQGRGRTADLPLFRRTLVPTELPARATVTLQDRAGGPETVTGGRVGLRRRPEPAGLECNMDQDWNDELIEVERRGWDALCSPGGADYYRQHLTEDALMAFPFGVLTRREALDAIADAAPWSRYEMTATRVVSLGAEAGVVVYAVRAEREGQAPF